MMTEGIKVSDRITAITGMVTPCGVAADIGCDHCLTLMSIIANGVCRKGIGSDIKRGPLEKARANIRKFGCEDKIELRIGFGLDSVGVGEADAIIISGMGGRVINDILEKGLHVARAAGQLIIQPQNEIRETRKCLHRLGFRILSENMVTEQGKYYTIIKAAKGFQQYEREIDYAYGKELIEARCPTLARYLNEALMKNGKIAEALKAHGTENCASKLARLEKENQMTKEALKCLLK